mgnify:CR=1 FL=1
MRRYPAHFGVAASFHREIDGSLTLAKGHDIARHRVLYLMAHGARSRQCEHRTGRSVVVCGKLTGLFRRRCE